MWQHYLLQHVGVWAYGYMRACACWLYVHVPAGSDRDWPLSLASSTALRNISTTRGPLFRTSSGGNSRGLPRTFRPVRVVRRPETVDMVHMSAQQP